MSHLKNWQFGTGNLIFSRFPLFDWPQVGVRAVTSTSNRLSCWPLNIFTFLNCHFQFEFQLKTDVLHEECKEGKKNMASLSVFLSKTTFKRWSRVGERKSVINDILSAFSVAFAFIYFPLQRPLAHRVISYYFSEQVLRYVSTLGKVPTRQNSANEHTNIHLN